MLRFLYSSALLLLKDFCTYSSALLLILILVEGRINVDGITAGRYRFVGERRRDEEKCHKGHPNLYVPMITYQVCVFLATEFLRWGVTQTYTYTWYQISTKYHSIIVSWYRDSNWPVHRHHAVSAALSALSTIQHKSRLTPWCFSFLYLILKLENIAPVLFNICQMWLMLVLIRNATHVICDIRAYNRHGKEQTLVQVTLQKRAPQVFNSIFGCYFSVFWWGPKHNTRCVRTCIK